MVPRDTPVTLLGGLGAPVHTRPRVPMLALTIRRRPRTDQAFSSGMVAARRGDHC
jgi:uncharacterized membrane-anchored protein